MDGDNKMNGKVTPNHNGEVKNLPLEHVDPADLNQEGSKAALCDDSNDCETGNPKVGYSVLSHYLTNICKLA